MKKNAVHELLEKMMKEDGNVLCEICSTPNWKLYHTPGNPCPHATPNAAGDAAKEGEKK